jgi:KUP system potassium uptake protein
LHRCVARDLNFNMMETWFFLGRLKIVPAKNSRLGRIPCQVFEVMHRAGRHGFLSHPPNRVIELGSQTEI